MVGAESGTPNHVDDLAWLMNGSTCVYERLYVPGIWMLGSVLQCCNDAVFTTGERCHDDKTGRREEEGHLLLTQWPIHSHIGEYERLFVGLPGELYSRCFAHYT